MIKSILLLLLFLMIRFCSFGEKLPLSERIKDQIEYFVDTVKKQSIKNGDYNVYILKVSGTDSDHFCFEISYIENANDLKYINLQYFFKIGKEIFLVDSVLPFMKTALASLNIRKIDDNNIDIIRSKLYSFGRGRIISEPSGMLYCLSNENTYRRYFDNADDMPSSIYNYVPPVVPKLIYDPTKQKK